MAAHRVYFPTRWDRVKRRRGTNKTASKYTVLTFWGGSNGAGNADGGGEGIGGNVVQNSQFAGSSNPKFQYFRPFLRRRRQGAAARERWNVQGREGDLMASKYGDIVVWGVEVRFLA